MGFEQELSLQVRVDLGVMAIKEWLYTSQNWSLPTRYNLMLYPSSTPFSEGGVLPFCSWCVLGSAENQVLVSLFNSISTFVGYLMQKPYRRIVVVLFNWLLQGNKRVHIFLKGINLKVWKNSHLISSERSNLHVINNLSITVYAFPLHILTLLSLDEILLPRYVKWCTNFKGLPFNGEMAPSCLQHMNSVLSE